ncbi:MAG: PBSX family phage terminase large subunit [Patescibacteria group bacterium]
METEILIDEKYQILYDTPPQIRFVLVYGPRGSGKSFEVSRAAMVSLDAMEYCRGFLMRNVLDTVRDSIFQDCKDRIEEMGLDYYVIDSGGNMRIQNGQNFFKGRGFKKSSGSDTAKNKSLAGYNRIIIEESEEIEKDDFYSLDLSLRTTKGQVLVCLVFNPMEKGHWILDDWFDLLPATLELVEKHYGIKLINVPEDKLDGYFVMVPKSSKNDTAYIFSSYHTNIENLDPNTVRRMESFRETDLDYYLHKIIGLVPSMKTGLVFKNWRVCTKEEFDSIPGNEYFGLDWGFSQHPSAAVRVRKHNNILGIRKVFYEKGLTNPKIAEILKDDEFKNAKWIADPAEPKSIRELTDLGLWVVGAEKGQDSVRHGIDYLDNFDEILICEDSPEIVEEFSNYSWKLNRLKEPTGEPIDEFNHAIDAVRYATEALQRQYNILDYFS